MALVWLQFGYSSGVWTKQMFACNAFGSQRMSCISASQSTFWYWDYARGGVSKMQQCQSLICLCGTGRWGLLLVTTGQVCGSVTPPWHLQMIDSSVGWSSAQEWQGSGVRGRGHRELGHILAPERTNSNTFLELRIFLKQERGYIFLHFFLFLFFFSEVLVLSLRKSPSEVSIHNEVTF